MKKTYELQPLSGAFRAKMGDFENDEQAMEWADSIIKSWNCQHSQLIRFSEQITTFSGIQAKRAAAALVTIY